MNAQERTLAVDDARGVALNKLTLTRSTCLPTRAYCWRLMNLR